MFARALALVLLAATSTLACSSQPITTTSGDPAQNEGEVAGRARTTPTSRGGTCCLSDHGFFVCANRAALNKCAGFDIFACMDACATVDCYDQCFDKSLEADHDPSDCVRDPSRDGVCGANPITLDPEPAPEPAPVTPECKGTGTSPTGAGCSLNTQCCSLNCTSGTCQTNDVGAKCSLNTQCDSNNCTLGACQGNDAGSPCSLNTQCTSKNCTGGKCQL